MLVSPQSTPDSGSEQPVRSDANDTTLSHGHHPDLVAPPVYTTPPPSPRGTRKSQVLVEETTPVKVSATDRKTIRHRPITDPSVEESPPVKMSLKSRFDQTIIDMGAVFVKRHADEFRPGSLQRAEDFFRSHIRDKLIKYPDASRSELLRITQKKTREIYSRLDVKRERSAPDDTVHIKHGLTFEDDTSSNASLSSTITVSSSSDTGHAYETDDEDIIGPIVEGDLVEPDLVEAEVVENAHLVPPLPLDVSGPMRKMLRYVPESAPVFDAGNGALFHTQYLDKGGERIRVAIPGGIVHIRPKSVRIVAQTVTFATRKELTDFLLGRFPFGGVINGKTYSNVALPRAAIRNLPGSVLITY